MSHLRLVPDLTPEQREAAARAELHEFKVRIGSAVRAQKRGRRWPRLLRRLRESR